MAPTKRTPSRRGTSRARRASPRASVKDTPKLRMPMTTTPSRAARKPGSITAEGPSEQPAKASEPNDSVTCRMSSGSPKKLPMPGPTTSSTPRVTLPPTPAAWCISASATRRALRSPSTARRARWWASASGRRR
ncbi:hypothetical protein COSO111634_18230 [Corallococcus soli]